MIAGGNFRVFLSAVSSEFETARSHVASDLRSRGLEIKEQEDFRQEAGADTTLRKLHDYIQECSAVVCIVGGRSGAFPPEPAAQPFAGLLPEGIAEASYTQWELLFARHHHKHLSLYVANPDYTPDKPPPARVDDAELQQRFVAYLMGLGLDYTPFSTVDELCRHVLREEWPHSQGRNIVRQIAAIAVLVLVVVAAMFSRWGPFSVGSTSTASPDHAAAETPLSGTVDVMVWSPGDKSRRGLSLTATNALPLQNSDQIRVEATLNRPAFVYLIWIGSQGEVLPVYPWEPGDWNKLPQQPKPVDTLRLPETADEGWPVTGAGGMETLMLLARESPLPPNFKLRDLLGDLPQQSMQSNRSIAWFADGKLVLKPQDGSRERAPNFFNPQQIDDPVLRTQRLLQQRLSPHFTTIRAVSFAHAGN